MDDNPLPLDKQLFAVFGAVADIIKPRWTQVVREVLEANPAIVKQDEASLTHLAGELVAALVSPMEQLNDER